jgi:P4 family phage/plasmid primase-like protien
MVEELLNEYKFKNVENLGLFVWNGEIWEKIKKNEEGIISRAINKRLKNESKQAHRNNVKEILQSRDEIEYEQEEFQTPKKMIPFNNGIYDIEKDELLDHSPEYNFTFKYNANYKPELKESAINELIQEIAPESKKKRKKLKEILAIAIAPWKVNQKVPVFYGKGANGKNQIVKIDKKIVGTRNFHKTEAHSLQNDKFETASIMDKQVAFFDEFEDASKPGKLKALVGDSEQKVREMHKESYTVRTSVYGIFAANELPNTNDNSDGFYRRWEIIDFNQKFTSIEGDGNPDKMEPWKLEEKYMGQESIDVFATELVGHLRDVLDRGKIVNEATTEETRRIWNRKSGNAVYAFIDKYLTQGNFSYDQDEDNFQQNDWIAKDDLKDIVNEYMEFHNNSSIRKDQLTRALKGHPDIDADCNYRPRTKDGDRVMAYGGIKINPGVVRDVNAISTSLRTRTRGSLEKINHRKWVDMVDHPPVKQVIRYLLVSDNDQASLFEVIRNTDIKQTDISKLNESEILEVKTAQEEGMMFPSYKLDQDKKEELKEKAENLGEKTDMVIEKIKELDEKGDGVDVGDVIEAVELSESVVEDTIQELQNEGEAYEPQPGKVGVL